MTIETVTVCLVIVLVSLLTHAATVVGVAR